MFITKKIINQADKKFTTIPDIDIYNFVVHYDVWNSSSSLKPDTSSDSSIPGIFT